MKKHIIVCDDDKTILEVIKDILEEEGYKVSLFADCKNILDLVSEHKPDLIILDIWMPKFNGNEAVKQLKANLFSKNIPIVLISALNEGLAISKELRVEGYIKKPFDIDDLLTTVKKSLHD